MSNGATANLSADDPLIEQIVRQVLGQLQPPAQSQEPPKTPVPPTVQSGILQLTETVITEALLAEKLGQSKVVQLKPKAIITPSGRDYLRKNQITIQTKNKTASGSTVSTWKVLVQTSTPAVETVLADLRKRQPGVWQRELVGGMQEIAEKTISAICRAESRGVVVFTTQAEVLACRVNRNRKVRAAAVNSLQQLDSLLPVMSPNVWIISPQGKPFFELRRMLERAASTVPAEPANWN